jgi:hypothetical protein
MHIQVFFLRRLSRHSLYGKADVPFPFTAIGLNGRFIRRYGVNNSLIVDQGEN